MKLSVPQKRTAPENTLSLINIVFLMLIFFLVAGHMATQSKGDVQLTEFDSSQSGKPPKDAIAITAKGRLSYKNQEITRAELLPLLQAERQQGEQVIKILPDKMLPAIHLIDILEITGQAGYKRAKIISLRKRAK